MARTVFESPFFGALLFGLSKFYLKLSGWRRVGRMPEVLRCVMIAAPHTSNWDAPIALAMVFAFRLKAHWLIKHTAFRWPFRRLLKWLGAIPIDRTRSTDVVTQMVEELKKSA